MGDGPWETMEEFDDQLPGRRFDLLADTIPHKIVERLQMIYRDVDDIDLFIGGIVETSVPGK